MVMVDPVLLLSAKINLRNLSRWWGDQKRSGEWQTLPETTTGHASLHILYPFLLFFFSDILHFNFPRTSYLPGVSEAKGKLFSLRRLRKWLLTKFSPELKRGDGAIHYSMTERKSRDVVEGSDRGAIQSGEPCLLPDAYCLEYSRTLFFGTAISYFTLMVPSHVK